MRGYLYDHAWWAGWYDGLADAYDCRQFPSFELFTAYGRGREAGIKALGDACFGWEEVA